MKLKTGDTVRMLVGKDRGKQGKILRVIPSTGKVVVEKLNMVKKHLKPTSSAPHGGIQEVERFVLANTVILICPHCNRATRIGHTLSGEGKYVRICRKCAEVIDTTK